eukprot:TRINITY_DN66218_c9_g1_i1.p1 TRINITY_DN66218_c9_g1~~TRINITY_DN66218_c9_g1_i1.p1  ORF type:complete len:601 (+),score=298.12 TRINITY_DN66218_c9_g1_i1:63-1805(+)
MSSSSSSSSKRATEHSSEGDAKRRRKGGYVYQSRKAQEDPLEHVNSVIVQFESQEGEQLGAPLEIPFQVTMHQMQQLVNQQLGQVDPEDRLPYSFWVNNTEVVDSLKATVRELGDTVSTERTISVVYQPQAVFRVRSVTRCSNTIPGHTEAVLHTHFSPDGKDLASGSGDTTVRVWDVNTSTPKFTLTGHKNWVLAVAWSPNARWLASGGMDGQVRIWNPRTGKLHGRVLFGHKKWITALAWEPMNVNPQCTRVASSSKDGTIKIWDIVKGQCVLSLSGHTAAVKCIRWGGCGLIYSASQDRTIKVWEASTGKLCRTLKGHAHWVNTLSLSTDYVLRTGPFDHKGRTGVNVKRFIDPPAAVAADADAGEKKEESVTTNSNEQQQQNQKKKNNNKKKKKQKRKPDPPELPETEEYLKAVQELCQNKYKQALAACGGKELLVSGSDDFTLFLWDPANTKEPINRLTGHQQPVNFVLYSPDAHYIASASFDNSVRLWDGRSGKFQGVLRGHVQSVYQVCWSADSRLLVSSSKDSTLKCWDPRTRKCKVDLPGHADEVFAVDWSPDGERVVSGGKDCILKIWRN